MVSPVLSGGYDAPIGAAGGGWGVSLEAVAGVEKSGLPKVEAWVVSPGGA